MHLLSGFGRRRFMALLPLLVAAIVVCGVRPARAQDSTEDDTAEAPSVVADTAVAYDTVTAVEHDPNRVMLDSAGLARVTRDTAQVTAHSLTDSAFRKYDSDNDFDYNREQRAPETLWQRLLRWLYKSFSTLVGGDEAVGTVWKWLIYLLAAAGVVLVVLKLIGADIRGLFLPGSRTRVSPFAELDENIHEMNFDALIEEAVAAKQYRRAVRLLYLKGLKALADNGAIDWRKDKTNRDYQHELRENMLRAPFADATTLFEFVWYGDMPLNESSFRSVRENLDGFITTINRRS